MAIGIFDEYSKIRVRKRQEEKRKSPRLYTENPTLLVNSNAHNRKKVPLLKNNQGFLKESFISISREPQFHPPAL